MINFVPEDSSFRFYSRGSVQVYINVSKWRRDWFLVMMINQLMQQRNICYVHMMKMVSEEIKSEIDPYLSSDTEYLLGPAFAPSARPSLASGRHDDGCSLPLRKKLLSLVLTVKTSLISCTYCTILVLASSENSKVELKDNTR